MTQSSTLARVTDTLRGPLVFVGLLWAAYLLEWVSPVDLRSLGLVPRSLRGLAGIITMPFLHAGLGHLAANTLPLVVLLGLLSTCQPRPWPIVAAIAAGGGLLLWLLGQPGIHIGASGLVFGLIAFLILSGLLERKPLALAVAVVVAVFYGGTLVAGVLPFGQDGVSWDGHLTSAVAGAATAYVLSKRPSPIEPEA
jgi:membrane associated rhomboid family serine protease